MKLKWLFFGLLVVYGIDTIYTIVLMFLYNDISAMFILIRLVILGVLTTLYLRRRSKCAMTGIKREGVLKHD